MWLSQKILVMFDITGAGKEGSNGDGMCTEHTIPDATIPVGARRKVERLSIS
jgi:hypothetical protein